MLHATPSLGETSGDAFFFSYGVVVFWGISTADEQALMHTVVRPCCVAPLSVRDVEIDSFSYNYSAVEPPHVQVAGRAAAAPACRAEHVPAKPGRSARAMTAQLRYKQPALPPLLPTQNDVITLNKRFAADHQVKMAISHALSQSTKLAVYEERLQVSGGNGPCPSGFTCMQRRCVAARRAPAAPIGLHPPRPRT